MEANKASPHDLSRVHHSATCERPTTPSIVRHWFFSFELHLEMPPNSILSCWLSAFYHGKTGGLAARPRAESGGSTRSGSASPWSSSSSDLNQCSLVRYEGASAFNAPTPPRRQTTCLTPAQTSRSAKSAPQSTEFPMTTTRRTLSSGEVPIL